MQVGVIARWVQYVLWLMLFQRDFCAPSNLNAAVRTGVMSGFNYVSESPRISIVPLKTRPSPAPTSESSCACKVLFENDCPSNSSSSEESSRSATIPLLVAVLTAVILSSSASDLIRTLSVFVGGWREAGVPGTGSGSLKSDTKA